MLIKDTLYYIATTALRFTVPATEPASSILGMDSFSIL